MFLLPKFVASLKSCVDCESTRYALAGIRLEQLPENRARAEASDGRVLCRVDWQHDEPGEFPEVPGFDPSRNGVQTAVIPAKTVVDVCRAIPKRSPKRILENAAVTLHSAPNGEPAATFAVTDLERGQVIPTRCIDGRWPKTDEVIPCAESAVSHITFDARKLQQLLDVIIAAAIPDEPAGFELRVIDCDHAAVLHAKNSKAETIGVIMPLIQSKSNSEQIEAARQSVKVHHRELDRAIQDLAKRLDFERECGSSVDSGELDLLHSLRDALNTHSLAAIAANDSEAESPGAKSAQVDSVPQCESAKPELVHAEF